MGAKESRKSVRSVRRMVADRFRTRFPHAPRYATEVFSRNGGFTTVGTACALLAACGLVFAGAFALRSQSRAAGVQAVADTAALAAQNEVAEFVIAARVADASLLSMSLTGLSLVGAGTVCCCVPPAAAAGKTMIETGRALIAKRDEMAKTATRLLSGLQDALPAAAALQAQGVISENADALHGAAIGHVELVPREGEPLECAPSKASQEAADAAASASDEIAAAAQEAARAREDADAALREGFLHDCGNAPGYCMYERADVLASLPASQNPLYHSAGAWSFSVALKRAQAYYPARAAVESPQDASVEEQARSALRKRFYEYASREVAKGYAHDDGKTAPDISLPMLPRNTEEMKKTTLYTDACFPVAGGVLHAWEGCPGASSGASGTGSLAEQDAGAYGTCAECGLDAVAMGKVAAASSSIENGFEYHYRIVAQAARTYCDAMARALPAEEGAKEASQGVFDGIVAALEEVGSSRIEAFPPGRYGSLCAVAFDAEGEGDVSFARTPQQLGSFASVSSAVLAEDAQEDVLSSLLDGVVDRIGPPLSDAGPAVLGVWSSMVKAYSSGAEGLCEGLEGLLSSVPLLGSDRLGSWASDTLMEMMEAAGLEPADVDAPKPFIANSEHVARRGDGPVAEAVCALKGKLR
ncbi:MAG: hypothetical protein Q4B35_01750 [Slackia sp.]|nr:hypothetical protein [Slackia sp.]